MQHQQTLQQRETRTAKERILGFVGRALRHWFKAGTIIAVGGALSVAMALMAKPKYKSESVLLYREVIDSQLLGSERRVRARDVGLRLRELVLGRARLKQLINELKLLPKTVETMGIIAAEDKLRNLIELRIDGGDTFHISYMSKDPEQAQKVVKRLAEVMIEEEANMRVKRAQAKADFLEKQRKRTETDLQARVRRRQELLVSYPEFRFDAEVRNRQRQQEKDKGPVSNSPMAILRRQRARLEEMLARARSGKKPTVVRDAKAEAAKAQAEAQLATAKRNLQRLRTQFTDIHPQVRSAKALVAIYKQHYLDHRMLAAQATKTGLFPISREAHSHIEKSIREIKGRIAALRRSGGKPSTTDTNGRNAPNVIVQLEATWQRFNREVSEFRERYTRVEAQAFRAKIQAASYIGSGALTVVDKAYLPKRPTGGRKKKVVMLGAAVSFFLAVGLMFGLAILDERIYNRKDAAVRDDWR
jgi:uncharacterized protein involved in exopolysaccharide biosynthesis